MTTTSGWCSRAAGTACCPSGTAATTSMSSCRPSSNSSASEKTWLSSTNRTRIGGAATVRRLFRREEKGVMRLAALLDVHLELGMALLEPSQEWLQLRLVLAGEEGEHASGLGEEPLRDRGCDRVEVGPGGDRRAAGQAEVLALADRETVQLC